MTTETLQIEGMSCDHCVRAVREALDGLEGVRVESVRVGEAQVEIDDETVSRADVAAAVEAEGYTVVG